MKGWLEINVNLSSFEEGNTTINAAEVMDVFWKIVAQMPEQEGRVPSEEGSVPKAYWRMKPYLNPEDF